MERKIRLDIQHLRGQASLDALNVDLRPTIADLPSEQLRRWFFSSDLAELLVIKHHIDNLRDSDTKNLGLVCFSEILRRSSKAHSSYANLMIDKNAKPKKNILELFTKQLAVGRERVTRLWGTLNLGFISEVVKADAKNLKFLRDETFDLVVSHPPYIAAVPYAEFMRLSLLWLGADPGQIEKQLMAGQRRRKDVADRFFFEMKLVFSEMFRVLKREGRCCVVIGNPESHGRVIELNTILRSEGEDAGFKFELEIPAKKNKHAKGKATRRVHIDICKITTLTEKLCAHHGSCVPTKACDS